MSALLRAEVLKLRTTRTFAALVGSALALSVLFSVLGATIGDTTTAEEARDVANSDTSSLFILILAVVGITGEWRHRTITGTVLAAPDRIRLIAAKAIAYALAGMLLSLIVSVLSKAVAVALLAARDQATPELLDLLDLLWRGLVVAALLGAFGIGFGALVRNQAGAIVLVMVLLLVLEPTVLALAPDVGRYLPLGGASSGVTGGVDGDDEDLLPAGLAALVLAGWSAGLCAAAAVTLQRRDLT